jgi:hypothetical protein
MIIGGLLSLLLTVFWVWMMIDCATGKGSGTEKVAWLLIIFFGNLIGALLYFFIARRKFRS